MPTFNMYELKKLADFVEATSIWKPTDVTQEPHVRMHSWQVYLVKGKLSTDPVCQDTIHFNGYIGYEGRVSSPVLQYDAKTHRGVTASGRIYELVGASGYNGDAQYVWNRWLGMMGNPESITVSENYK